MNKLSQILSLTFLVLIINGCTFTLNIDTDYASQRDGSGSIEEQVSTATTASTDPKVDASVEVPGTIL